MNRLVTKELTALNAEDLNPYTTKAMTTVGEVADFKYFLPRILALLLEDPRGWPDLGLLLSKLDFAQFKMWEAKEIEAIVGYLDASLNCLDKDAIEEWLSELALFVKKGRAPKPLKQWFESPKMLKKMAEFYQNQNWGTGSP